MPLPAPSMTKRKLSRNLHLWEVVAIRELCILGLVACLLWLCFQLQAILVPVLIGLGGWPTWLPRRWITRNRHGDCLDGSL